jgi:hypothetical protein
MERLYAMVAGNRGRIVWREEHETVTAEVYLDDTKLAIFEHTNNVTACTFPSQESTGSKRRIILWDESYN